MRVDQWHSSSLSAAQGRFRFKPEKLRNRDLTLTKILLDLHKNNKIVRSLS